MQHLYMTNIQHMVDFLVGLTDSNSEFSPWLVVISRIKGIVCPTIYAKVKGEQLDQ